MIPTRSHDKCSHGSFRNPCEYCMIENLDDDLRGCKKKQKEENEKINTILQKHEKNIDNMVTHEVFYSSYQNMDAWKRGAEVLIAMLEKKVNKLGEISFDNKIERIANLERKIEDFMQKSSLNCQKVPKYCSECGNKNE